MSDQKVIDASETKGELGKIFPALVFAFQMFFIILSWMYVVYMEAISL